MLLISAVALSAALISAVACAMASAGNAIKLQLESQIGSAELRIRSAGSDGVFDRSVLEAVRAHPGVEAAVPRMRMPVSIEVELDAMVETESGSFVRGTRALAASGFGNGVDLGVEFDLRPPKLVAGRLPEREGEILIDALFAELLSVAYADDLAAGGFDAPGTRTGYLDRPRPDLPEMASGLETGRLNDAVGIRPGDTITVVRQLGIPVSAAILEQFGIDERTRARVARMLSVSAKLETVGIAEPPPLGGLPQMWMGEATAAVVTGQRGMLDQIEVELDESLDAELVAEALSERLPDTVVVQTTEKVSSALDDNLSGNQIGFFLASMLAMLSAAFIIMTGLNTGVAEQQKQLAVLRCIGARKPQLVTAQLLTGLIVGGVGSLIGTPLGVFFAWLVVTIFEEHLSGGLTVPPGMLTFSGIGSVVSGLAGALWPAWRVSRVSPLEALASRAAPTKPGHVGVVLALGLLGLIVQLVVVGTPKAGESGRLFWGYATLGLPAMFVGYFLLSVPAVVLVTRLLAAPLSTALRLPPRVLGRTVAATPFRHGFTAGAMMTGLALMISIWTNGGSVLRDWLDNIAFPDGFLNGLRLPPEAKTSIESLPWVNRTCAISMHPVETDAFGIEGVTTYRTTFIAFEPEPFFEMTGVRFIQGDAETATRRLNEGGAIIVGQEFTTAQGLGLGDTFVCGEDGETYEFEIVGVVTSPGLELASKFFNIGEEYLDQALHAVFGSRVDLKEKFDSDAIQLIQVSFDQDRLAAAARQAAGPDADEDRWAESMMREATFGMGVLDVGTGRRIKARIRTFIGGSLVVFSAVAVSAMLVACFGVANLIAAGIEARQFEFGVLRAIGGPRGLVLRLVAGEAVLIAVTAMLIGTCMGIQGAWAGSRLYELLVGVAVQIWPPPLRAIAFGCGVVLLFTVGAAIPSIARLNGRSTRQLLQAAKG